MRRIADELPDPYLADLGVSDVLWDEVVAVVPKGEAPVFDATVARHAQLRRQRHRRAQQHRAGRRRRAVHLPRRVLQPRVRPARHGGDHRRPSTATGPRARRASRSATSTRSSPTSPASSHPVAPAPVASPTVLFATLLALASATLHAAWNLFVKTSDDRELAAWGQWIAGGLLFLPFLLFAGLPEADSWPFLLSSSLDPHRVHLCARERVPPW